jgi:hypothetical protein
MTEEFFTLQMGRLGSVFGEKNFQREKLKLIFNACSRLPEASFEKIITHFISTFRQAPLPTDFFQATLAEARSLYSGGSQRSEVPYSQECDICNDSGITNVRLKDTTETYFINCACADTEVGSWKKKVQWPQLPTWHPSMYKHFDLIPMLGEEAKKWKPNRYDRRHPIESLNSKTSSWAAHIKKSAKFYESILKED